MTIFRVPLLGRVARSSPAEYECSGGCAGKRWLQALIRRVRGIVAVLATDMPRPTARGQGVRVRRFALPGGFSRGTRYRASSTDFHRGPFLQKDRVRSLVERVNRAAPDLVLLGGDYVFMSTDYAASLFENWQG